MFSNLLKQAELAMQQAKSSSNSMLTTLAEAKNALGVSSFPSADPSYNPRLHSGPVASFPKSERFRNPQKQPLTFTDAINYSTMESESAAQGVTFAKQQRFRKEKTKEQTLLYPKLDLVKKSQPAAGIKPLSEKEISIMGKSTVSHSTLAESVASLGPGTYNPSCVPANKITKFAKGKRFESEKPVIETPLYPKDVLTRKRPPTAAVLMAKTSPSANLISRDKQQQLRERLKMLYWQAVPLEYDRLFRSSIGPVLRQSYFQASKMTGVQRRCAMQMLIDRMNYLRGGFEFSIRQEEAPCTVAYRKSTPKPFKFPQHLPGPDEYHPKDDLVKPTAIGFTFARNEDKPAEEDGRDYDINDQLARKIHNVIINPEHQPKRLTPEEIANLNRGPGFYDAIFRQVQRRADVGVVKLPELTQANDRVQNMYQKREVNDGVYFPKYTAIDPNVGVPIYKLLDKIEPMHLPDKVLYPEHWEFYDGDINAIRAELAKNVLVASGLSFQQYQKYVRQFATFKDYMARQKQTPDVGEYNPNYKQLDPNILIPDLDRMQERGLEPIVKKEGEVDGDNLILNPDKPRANIPGFDMSKQIAREQPQTVTDDPKEGDALLLNPQLPPKKLADIKFEKQLGRESVDEQNEDGEDGNRLLLNPIYPDKHIPQVKMDKYRPREQPALPFEAEEQPLLLIDPQYTQVDTRVTGFVEMERHSQVRLVPILRESKKKGGQQEA